MCNLEVIVLEKPYFLGLAILVMEFKKADQLIVPEGRVFPVVVLSHTPTSNITP